MRAQVYSKDYCGWCRKAKELLTERGISFEDIPIGGKADLDALIAKIGKTITTVPQIFLDGEYVGGYTDLERLLRD
jgi:glutaredoxin